MQLRKVLKFWSARLFIIGLALLIFAWLEYSVFTVYNACGSACASKFWNPIIPSPPIVCIQQCVSGYFANPIYAPVLQMAVLILLASAYAFILEGRKVRRRKKRK